MPLRSGPEDGHGPLIPGCQNVQPSARATLPFQTKSYNSTWTSALVEGAAQGLGAGIAGSDRAAEHVWFSRGTGRDAPPGLPVTRRMDRVEPFCRRFDAPRGKVLAALRRIEKEILGPSGYRFESFERKYGAAETGFACHRHAAARWCDKFRFEAVKRRDGGTSVAVLRLLYISRDGRVYNQAISAGANEAALLTRLVALTGG